VNLTRRVGRSKELSSIGPSEIEPVTRNGESQSHAIRSALLKASRAARLDQMEADAKRLGSDPHDRAVVAEIRAFMDELAPPW
jgi:hypothetical protein